ncbi:MAG: hypothetical protein V1678_01845 [Candidatus Aenigmatarchaeota archaeon]
MSFSRSLAILILSLIFTSSFFLGISSYTLGDLIQRESIKQFMTDQGMKLAGQQCQHECGNDADYKGCIGNCTTSLNNQVNSVVGTAIDEIYKQSLFGTTLNEISYLASQYFIFLIIGTLAGVAMFIISKNPFSTLGKDLITIAISLFISTFSTNLIVGYANLPIDIMKALSDYFAPGFNLQNIFGLVFLAVGIAFLVINRMKHIKKK